MCWCALLAILWLPLGCMEFHAIVNVHCERAGCSDSLWLRLQQLLLHSSVLNFARDGRELCVHFAIPVWHLKHI